MNTTLLLPFHLVWMETVHHLPDYRMACYPLHFTSKLSPHHSSITQKDSTEGLKLIISQLANPNNFEPTAPGLQFITEHQERTLEKKTVVLNNFTEKRSLDCPTLNTIYLPMLKTLVFGMEQLNSSFYLLVMTC
jgi:hypothetical protein